MGDAHDDWGCNDCKGLARKVTELEADLEKHGALVEAAKQILHNADTVAYYGEDEQFFHDRQDLRDALDALQEKPNA